MRKKVTYIGTLFFSNFTKKAQVRFYVKSIVIFGVLEAHIFYFGIFQPSKIAENHQNREPKIVKIKALKSLNIFFFQLILIFLTNTTVP